MRTEFKYTRLPETGILVASDSGGRKLYKAIDVARALGYRRPDAAVKRFCRDTVTLVAPTFNQFGGRFDQPVKFIGAEDAARMLNCSTLPSAAKIRRKLEDSLAEQRAGKAKRDKKPAGSGEKTGAAESFASGIEAVIDIEISGDGPAIIVMAL